MQQEMHSPISRQSLPILSAYVHSHQVDEEVVALYHPFGHEVALVSLPVYDLLRVGDLQNLPSDIYEDLVTRHFLVSDDWDKAVLDQYATKPISGFFSLWLIVVQTCNIGCTYCVVEADTQPNTGRMSPEVAERAVEVFRESLNRHQQPVAKVTLYGGEPLLNRPLLKHIIPKIRAMTWLGQQEPIEILCFTNGITYDEDLTQCFLDHDVTVGISLDGDKSINDQARVFRKKQGTYDKVIASYDKYRAAGVRVGLSCTLGNHNKGQLLNVVSHFVNDLKAPSIQFQVPIQVADGSPNYLNMAILARETLDAFEVARSANVEEGLAMRRLTAFSAGRFHHRDCAAVGGELAVSTDGTVGPCHNATIGGEQYFCGNVMDEAFNPEPLPAFTEWHNRMPINMPGCHGCSAISLCGGGCPYNALLASGTIWEKDPQQCGYMSQFIDWLLEDIWARYSGKPRPSARNWQTQAESVSSVGGQDRRTPQKQIQVTRID